MQDKDYIEVDKILDSLIESLPKECKGTKVDFKNPDYDKLIDSIIDKNYIKYDLEIANMALNIQNDQELPYIKGRALFMSNCKNLSIITSLQDHFTIIVTIGPDDIIRGLQ